MPQLWQKMLSFVLKVCVCVCFEAMCLKCVCVCACMCAFDLHCTGMFGSQLALNLAAFPSVSRPLFCRHLLFNAAPCPSGQATLELEPWARHTSFCWCCCGRLMPPFKCRKKPLGHHASAVTEMASIVVGKMLQPGAKKCPAIYVCI